MKEQNKQWKPLAHSLAFHVTEAVVLQTNKLYYI